MKTYKHKQTAEQMYQAYVRIRLKDIDYHLKRQSWLELKANEKLAWVAAAKVAHDQINRGQTKMSIEQEMAELRAETRTAISLITSTLGERIRALEALEVVWPVPAGTAAFMPGTMGFTTVCFTAEQVPSNTKVYTEHQVREMLAQRG